MDVESERAYPTPLANLTILPMMLLSLARQKNAPKVATTFKKEYDFIVVGAGAAGSVVASRLSEIPCVSVLLLEAGKSPPVLNDIPGFSGIFAGTDLSWPYKTVPQNHTARGLINRETNYRIGKGLGGSSLLNAMLFVRGNRKTYDDWAAQGAIGWSYEDIFPYFLKLEDNQDPEYLANGYHAAGGPMTVDRPAYMSEIKQPILEAAESLGYEIIDPNSDQKTGIYDYQATLRDGQRCSAAKGYLVPAENRTNLDILPNALVKKIVIKNGLAMGVIFDYNNTEHEVRAKREVIVSAGTLNTAQLLMLSGIGPRKHLEELNIPVVADLPVGENFQDHCTSLSPYELDARIPILEHKLSDPVNIKAYLQNRAGVYAAPGIISLLAFLDGKNESNGYPNFELYFSELPASMPLASLGLTPEVYEKVFEPHAGKPLFACAVQGLRPMSRGTIELRSNNPRDPPLIDPNYLSDPRDFEAHIQGLKMCKKILSQKPLERIESKPFEALVPGCEEFEGDDDRYFRCVAETIIAASTHPVGTAKMGRKNDPTTVVDTKLRVKGIAGLRVVDASIMPIIPAGNTYIPTLMVAEKASDIIKSKVFCHGQ